MARSVRRILGRSVSFAFNGVRRGLGSAVRATCRRKSPSTSLDNSSFENITVKKANKIDQHGFPAALCSSKGPGGLKSQALITAGSRTWGNWWDGRGLLKVKLYDFAIYADKKQTQSSHLSTVLKKRIKNGGLCPSFYNELRSSPEIDMSLVVKASRNLPIKLMAGEYKKILTRRLERVGGASTDPALPKLLHLFEEESLPRSIRDRGNVKAGTVLTFRRFKNGVLCTEAEGQELGSVKSSDLCAALFDLYLGNNPVSRPAQTRAGETVVEFMQEAWTRKNERLMSSPEKWGGFYEKKFQTLNSIAA